ncbi:MAG: class I adenylate-forming enzyme family protein [Nitrospinota bacterium]
MTVRAKERHRCPFEDEVFSADKTASYRQSREWLNLTLVDWLKNWARERPEAAAVSGPARRLSFTELDAESDRLAGGLSNLGLLPGDVLGAQLPNCAEWLVLLYAATKIGAVFMPLHMPYREAELLSMLSFSGARAMAVPTQGGDASRLEMIEGLKPNLPSLENIIVIGAQRPGARSYGELVTGHGPPDFDPDPDDPFLLLFTSGTTAGPKAVLHTANIRLANAANAARELQMDAGEVCLSLSPLSHMFGVCSHMMAMSCGARTVAFPTFSPEGFLERVEAERVSMVFGAPAHAISILDCPDLPRRDIRSLRKIVLSGSVCPPQVASEIRERMDCTPVLLWGTTETQVGFYTRPGDPPEVYRHTIGRPNPGVEITLLDEEGRGVSAGREGELCVRGPSLFAGYYLNPEATAESFTAQGWYRTGDLAVGDAGGNYRLTGRKNDLINRGGVKFNPADVEGLLVCHPKISRAAMVGMPDPRLGERNCLFVIPAPGESPSLEEVVAHVERGGIAKNKWPERLEIVGKLPMTPTRKVRRSVLRQVIADKLREESRVC